MGYGWSAYLDLIEDDEGTLHGLHRLVVCPGARRPFSIGARHAIASPRTSTSRILEAWGDVHSACGVSPLPPRDTGELRRARRV